MAASVRLGEPRSPARYLPSRRDRAQPGVEVVTGRGSGLPISGRGQWSLLGVPPKGTADPAIGRRRARLQTRLASQRSLAALAVFIRQRPTRRDTIRPRIASGSIQLITSVGRHTGSRSAMLPGMAKRPKQTKQKNPAAVALGRLGGLRGRWKNIPPEQRSETMRKAAQARRTKKKRQKD